MKENYLQTLASLVVQSQELQKEIDAFAPIKQKLLVDEQIEKVREIIRERFDNGEETPGKHEAILPNGDKFSYTTRTGGQTCEVIDINALDSQYRKDEKIDNAGVLDDGTIYMIMGDDYYAKGDDVYHKEANLGLIKSYSKLGANIPGVLVKKRKSSVTLKLNDKTL